MTLIEGLGDEVTLIFALLTAIFVVLVAWLSTHTRDIPFFSVIVVELTQRGSRTFRGVSPNLATPVSEAHQEQQPEVPGASDNEASAPGGDESSETISQSASDSSQDVAASSNDAEDRVSSASEVTKLTDEHSELKANGSSEDEAKDESSIDDAALVEKSQIEPQKQAEIQSTLDLLVTETVATKLETVPSKSAEKSESSIVEENQENESQLTLQSSPSAVNTDPSDQVPVQTVPASEGPSITGTHGHDGSSTVGQTTGSSDWEGASVDGQGQIRIRLKYLNDTQRLVYSSPMDTIGQFRRAHFQNELAANKLVRLIFNGQDMRNDTSTLQGYNITDNSVIHCLITQNLQTAAPQHADINDGDLQIGAFMMPLFALILGAIWYLRFTQRQYFNAVSTLSLVGVSFLFVLGCMSMWRGVRDHQHVD